MSGCDKLIWADIIRSRNVKKAYRNDYSNQSLPIIEHGMVYLWWCGPMVTKKLLGFQGLSQYQDCLSKYGDSHDKDKTVVRPSYLYHEDPYTGKIAFWYWDGGSHSISLTHCGLNKKVDILQMTFSYFLEWGCFKFNKNSLKYQRY